MDLKNIVRFASIWSQGEREYRLVDLDAALGHLSDDTLASFPNGFVQSVCSPAEVKLLMAIAEFVQDESWVSGDACPHGVPPTESCAQCGESDE